MKILLVFPRIEHGASTFSDKGSWSSILFGYPIITLPHMAAITPRIHDVIIINENYDKINFDIDVDLVGITCYTMTAPRVYEIADKFRKRGKTVVLGGYHPTAMPDEALKHSDSIIMGMAEASWPQLLNDFEKGRIKRIYPHNTNFDMSDIPPLRRDLIRHNPLLGAIQTTRGCANRCEFCAISSFCHHGVRQRPIENVIEEIKQMPNKMFVIHDPHLTVNRKYAKELFKQMIKNDINKSWVSNGTTDILNAVDDEFLNLAKKSGCVEWFVGFESVSQAALNGIKKSHNKVEDFRKMIKRVHDHGMTIQGGIIFGFDEDTPDIFKTTIEKVNELEIDVLEINILTPYPGTPLFQRLDNEGRIFTKDWSKYNQVEVVYYPKNMSVEELNVGARFVAKEFYSWPNIIKRDIRIFNIVKRIGGILPAGTNYTFRKYYKADFGI
jgi:radical SAM superfamily enzyme YgiQ (UPF0313 family)